MPRTLARRWALISALFAVVSIAACSKSTVSKTTIPQYNRMPGYDGVVFKRLFVIGVGEDEGKRRLFEDAFVKVLASDNTSAQPSWERLPQSRLLTEQEIETAIGADEFDGVLITRLVSVEEDEEYVEGQTYRVQRPPLLQGYYQGSYKTVHEPGYYERRTTYRLETNLYAVSDKGLVWSGHSATVDPDSVEEGIDSLTQAVAAKLREQSLIR